MLGSSWLLSALLFISDLIGNADQFRKPPLNALTTAAVAVVFSLTIYLRYGNILMMEWGFAMMRPTP
jgi:hypothetical protein